MDPIALLLGEETASDALPAGNGHFSLHILGSSQEAARPSESPFVQFSFMSKIALLLAMSGPYRLALGAKSIVF